MNIQISELVMSSFILGGKLYWIKYEIFVISVNENVEHCEGLTSSTPICEYSWLVKKCFPKNII